MTATTAGRYVVLACLLALTGCGKPQSMVNPKPDMTAENAKRAAIYEQAYLACMASLPAGPEVTKYNDWDEVLDGCNRFASNKVGYSTGRYW